FTLGAGAMIEFLPQPAGIGVHLSNAIPALVINGQQFGFFGFDLRVYLRNQGRRAAVKLRRLWILVCLTHRRHAGVNRFFHQLTVQKISCGVRSLVFFISRFLIGIIGDAGFIRIINAGLFRVPFGVGGIIGGFPRLPILGILGASSEFRFA